MITGDQIFTGNWDEMLQFVIWEGYPKNMLNVRVNLPVISDETEGKYQPLI